MIRAVRKVLVIDGKTSVGQALVQALAKAGADKIWIGEAEPWKKVAGLEALRALPPATVVPLDLTDGGSVAELAGAIGGKVDILINTADHHRAFSITARRGVESAQLEMDVNYFGLLRLAQAFAPALRARAADEPVERDCLGQHPLDLCARQLSAARHLLGIEGGCLLAVASVARRTAAGRRAGDQRFPRPDR